MEGEEEEELGNEREWGIGRLVMADQMLAGVGVGGSLVVVTGYEENREGEV